MILRYSPFIRTFAYGSFNMTSSRSSVETGISHFLAEILIASTDAFSGGMILFASA